MVEASLRGAEGGPAPSGAFGGRSRNPPVPRAKSAALCTPQGHSLFLPIRVSSRGRRTESPSEGARRQGERRDPLGRLPPARTRGRKLQRSGRAHAGVKTDGAASETRQRVGPQRRRPSRGCCGLKPLELRRRQAGNGPRAFPWAAPLGDRVAARGRSHCARGGQAHGNSRRAGPGREAPPTPTPGGRRWMEVVDAGIAPAPPEEADAGSWVLTAS